ncbi:MAG: sigma-70 family RNA polymerase sigma factor [Phycisphaerales bacterium]|nr:sigma-70 family RNA polymerase sigma factor [Phycisphaerales bacterium]
MLTRTTTRLIEGLRDPANAEAWSGFDARYRPVLIAFASRLGFSHDDAAEVAQQALVEFARAYREGRYERERGRLSSWLIGIARNVASGMRRGRGAQRVGGDTMLGEMPDEPELTRIWSEERERAIFAEAMTILHTTSQANESTLRAFELFAIRGVPAEEAAAECGISVDAVYLAKSRLTKRLREIVRELTAAYDEGE